MMPHSKDYEKIVKTLLGRSMVRQDHFQDMLMITALISNLSVLEKYLPQHAYTLKRASYNKLKELNELVSDLITGIDYANNAKEAQQHA